MKRCTRCILPETVPGITFDHEGVCSFCQKHEKVEYLGKEAFIKIVDEAKSKKGRYDCVVPISGGRDSTYILHEANRTYGLNILAVNYDNEFRHEQAVRNMHNAAQALNVELLTVTSQKKLGKKIVLHRIRSAYPLELDVACGSLCGACTYGYVSAVYRAAAQHGIPLILWGATSIEKTIHMKIKGGEKLKGTRFLKLADPDFYRAEYYKWRQRVELPVAGNRTFSRKPPVLHNSSIREVRFFDYIPWDRRKIKETIMGELRWRKPEGHPTTWRTDCLLHTLVNYYSLRKIGCSRDCFGYCNMINSGQMERSEALSQEEKMQAAIGSEARDILVRDIGLSGKEIQDKKLYP